MRKPYLQWIALLLSLALLLSGCGMVDFSAYFDALHSTLMSNSTTHYRDMEYQRPDMDEIQHSLEHVCTLAAEGGDLDSVVEGIWDFYDVYDRFYTDYNLADIRYSADLTDTYWEEEYYYCVDNSAAVDAALEELYYALAASPLREELEGDEYFGAGYFDSYEGENLWDEAFVQLMEQEGALQNQYYDLSTQALDYEYGTAEYYDALADDMAQVLLDLIAVRQEMAAYWGYDDYTQFAFDFYYYRDYSVAEMESYLLDIRQELVPLYREVSATAYLDYGYDSCTEEDTFAYVRRMASNMGGTVEEAFELMDSAGLYDITYSENKYNSSFEVYLTSYWEPFVFMNPSQTTYDYLTFAHEFGHFCNDYASYGSYAGVDVAEVFSQGMEYLSLCYMEDTEELTRLKMLDSLDVYVVQAAFADFEQRIYDLTPEELTVEGLYDVYEQIALDYGFENVGYDPREFVGITHFYTNPLYVISYVVSNDAALQLYQLEQAEEGAGLAKFEDNLTTEEGYFLSFLDSAGLESPFAEGRIQAVRATFEEILG